MPRATELIQKLIWEKYAPKMPSGKVDPRTLYVGAFIDGLALYLPEMTLAFPSEAAQRPQEARRLIKSIISDIQSSGGRAHIFDIRDINLIMERTDWPSMPSGEPTLLRLSDRLRTTEPGELLNSAQIEIDPETFETRLTEFVRRPAGTPGERPTQPFEPLIREDKRFGLHYLLRGDKFSFSWTDGRRQARQLNWVLRPRGEGTSLITPDVAQKLITW